VAARAAAAGGAASDGARLIAPSGHARRIVLTPDQQLALYVRLVHRDAEGLVELMAADRRPDGKLVMRSRHDRQRYLAAGDERALVTAARRDRRAGLEQFVTPLGRARPLPGNASGVLAGRVVWVDVDAPEDLERMRRFRHRPHLVVYSGSGGAHAYWRLDRPYPPRLLGEAMRKLAHQLGGCTGPTAPASTMRLPGSINKKSGTRAVIAFCDLHRGGHALEDLVAGLSDPNPPPPAPDPETLRRWAERNTLDDARRVPPPVYFRLLAGVEVPEHGGEIRCPLPDHEDRNPSCHVYPTPERGWRCFGCGRGGRIYDLASLLEGGPWGRALRDEQFRQVKRQVWERLGITADEPNLAPAAKPAGPSTSRPAAGAPSERSTR
jgi:hypothetical protein